MIATTGFFDGVHTGHQSVLRRVVELARRKGEESAVITFWPHPRVTLCQDAERLRLLNTLEEKRTRLRALGIDRVMVVPFTEEFSRMPATQFFEDCLHQRWGVTTLVVGHDHRLGTGAGAGFEEMNRIGNQWGIQVEQVAPVADERADGAVSATKIRTALERGDVERANRWLGYSYRLEGVVVKGRQMGRTMGFPTANLQLEEPLKLVPQNGVYASRVEWRGNRYGAMTNIGHRPTVQPGDPLRTVETHLFDFSETVYGEVLRVELHARIRHEQRFASMEELKEQLQKDRLEALRQN